MGNQLTKQDDTPSKEKMECIMKFGSEKTVRTAIDRKWINATGADIYGRTPLHLSCKKNFKSLAKVLLTNGADPNVSDKSGTTPLRLACLENHVGIVRLLIENGALIQEYDFEMMKNKKDFEPFVFFQKKMLTILAARESPPESECLRSSEFKSLCKKVLDEAEIEWINAKE